MQVILELDDCSIRVYRSFAEHIQYSSKYPIIPELFFQKFLPIILKICRYNIGAGLTTKPTYPFAIKKCMTQGAVIGVSCETTGALQGKTQHQGSNEISAKPVKSVIKSNSRVCDVQSVNSILASPAITAVTLECDALTTLSSVNSGKASSRITTVSDVLATHNNVSCPIVTSAQGGPSGDTIPHCPVISSIYPMVQGLNKGSPRGTNEPTVNGSYETVVNWEQSTCNAEM